MIQFLKKLPQGQIDKANGQQDQIAALLKAVRESKTPGFFAKTFGGPFEDSALAEARAKFNKSTHGGDS